MTDLRALNSLQRRIEKWVSKVQRFASTASQNPRRLFSRLRHLPSSLKSSLRRKLLSLLDIKTDLVIKNSSYINFIGDYVGGGIEMDGCTQVTISNCTITAPPGKTPLVVGSSTLAIAPGNPLPTNPPALLPVVERALPIIGFRGWIVVTEKRVGVKLGSTGVGAFWQPTTNKAGCLADGDVEGRHEAPSADCHCGFYLMRRLDDVIPYTGDEAVYGAVVAWGRIIEHTDGFRAEYARPLALVKDSPLAEMAGNALGLPVVAREYLENYAKEFGEEMAV